MLMIGAALRSMLPATLACQRMSSRMASAEPVSSSRKLKASDKLRERYPIG